MDLRLGRTGAERRPVISSGTKKQFGILKELVKRPDVESLVCATDAGREGELIFRLVYNQCHCKKPFERLWISSMEDAAIREFFENPAGRIFAKRPKQHRQESRVSLLIDVQQKLQTKGPGYVRWAKIHNLKEMSKSLLFLREHGFETMEQLDAFISEKTEKRDSLLSSVRSAEKQITEIAALRKHIFNYANTRATYEAYRKAGYSRKFFEAHREEITIHKAAKKAFDELGVKRILKVKDLNAEYARLMAEKKQTFAEYRKARDEVKEYLIVRENIASLYEAERKENEADRKRQQEQER